jgi:MFS family permease
VFIALGVSQVLAGLVMNRVGDLFNRYRMASFGTVIVEVAIIISLLAYFLESYALCFVVSMLWGIS